MTLYSLSSLGETSRYGNSVLGSGGSECIMSELNKTITRRGVKDHDLEL